MTDVIIIGAGFYGLRIALHLREVIGVDRVLIFERETEPMLQASYANQARVHNGYHYPRSILTGYRSRANLPAFSAEFAGAIVDDFVHLYAVASKFSKVNSRQFELFARRIGAALHTATRAELAVFDRRAVDAVYRVEEPAFDATVVRDILLERVAAAGGIDLRTSDAVDSIRRDEDGLVVAAASGEYRSARVIGAGYAGMNELHRRSALPLVGLQHELTEMPLVRLPESLRGYGITVMDGPFFSVMPFPSRGLHTFSHVRYTPRRRWGDLLPATASRLERPTGSAFPHMVAAARGFAPAIASAVHEGSLWSTKVVLTRSDTDDSRPILFRDDHGVRGYTCVLGGKLDNVYDVLHEFDVKGIA